MRVLYIERDLRATSVVWDQIRLLRGCGVTARVIALQASGTPPLVDGDVLNIACPRFPRLEPVRSWLFVRAVWKATCSLGEAGAFDLVHAHFAYPEGMAARVLGREAGVSYVITGRGSDLLVYPSMGRYLRHAVARVVREARLFIGVSRHLCRTAEGMGVSPACCRFQPDGVPEAVFLWEPGMEAERVADRVLFAGAFRPVKNVLRLADAFALVRRRRPGAVLVLAGEGPLEGDLRRRLRDLGVLSQVTFTGHLPQVELAAQMRRAAVLVLPSLSEGWPNVVMEALACGTPVVASGVGGIPEQLPGPGYGLLCDPCSPGDIADTMLAALDAGGWDRQKLSDHGRRITRSKAAARIAEFYAEVLEDPKRGR
jgi:glycosyltransferase involved in cell wall biosynthesis